MKKYISFSGGVESRTMAMLYGRGATLLFSDTGAEHNALYESIGEFLSFLKIWHKGNIEFVKITPSVIYKGKEVVGLWQYMNESKFFPGPTQRFCTRIFKAQAIDNYLSDKGLSRLFIGFNYDEKDRLGSLEAMKNVVYDYPLVRACWGRDDCEAYLKHYGVHPEFPAYMSRGGCKMCFFKSVKEYKAMFHLNRQEFDEVRKLEESLQDKRGKNYAINTSQKTMAEIQAECESEIPFDIAEMYNQKPKQYSCGAFCMR